MRESHTTVVPITNTCNTGYPHICLADSAAYWHDCREDKRCYRHVCHAVSLSHHDKSGLEKSTRPLVFTSESSIRASGNLPWLARLDE